jgi:hypothetical protein
VRLLAASSGSVCSTTIISTSRSPATSRSRLEWEGDREEEHIWDSGATAGFGDPKHATDDNLDAGGMATSPAGKKKKIWFQMHVHQIWKTKLSSKMK